MKSIVKVWEEDVLIPTYEIGEADKNPMFLEKRIYQGSSGDVYPYPVIETVSDTKVDKLWHAVYLENEYLKIMLLPQLGGRVQMAFDKIKQRHFFYYNNVIKPALVGLTGPWISGGLEFNWPQHHRPSTYLPVDFKIEENADGSATVWINEQERMTHQKATVAFTLYPNRAVLEIKGKLFNPTPIPQTFLWWANPAVSVNDQYQSVFPPDVHAVFDHGKRDVSKFPIATGTYYKVDYSAGVDISKYKNIPVPTSYMAIKSQYDFVGGYENDTMAGVLHVANHHISPGKKQWTWGNGDFGQAWDRNLTDNDGPYIELMTGVYTDNQPDFSWLNPYEEKTFTQYFMPYRELGVVKNATPDLLLNIEEQGNSILLKLFATRELNHLNIKLNEGNNIVFEDTATLSPNDVYVKKTVPGAYRFEMLEVTVVNDKGKIILKWKPEKQTIRTTPKPAEPALFPKEIKSLEQLYLTGLHIEQYRHATYKAEDYYMEALARDASDIRCNNALGLVLLRRGKFADSVPYFKKAIETITQRNPNPYDGEPFYNLGLAFKYCGSLDQAYEMFYKSCWNAAWQDAGYYSLSQISCATHNWETALDEIEKSLVRNWHNHRARHLKSAILKHLGKIQQAEHWIQDSLDIDQFNYGCMFERYLITNKKEHKDLFLKLIRDESHNFEEIALDYINAGLYNEAILLLELCIEHAKASPLVYYYLAWVYGLKGDETKAKTWRISASQQIPDYCFPNRLEAIIALQYVLGQNNLDGYGNYYLGNIWYHNKQYNEAIACWEKATLLKPNLPTAFRNLSLAYFNKQNDAEKAIAYIEKAFLLDVSDARILMEFDQLRKRLNFKATDRLLYLSQYMNLVSQRDDLYLEYVTLLNLTGNFEVAKKYIDNRHFHPWEGGEGKVPAQYQFARLEIAKKLLVEQHYEAATILLNECFIYPHNLGEGKLYGAQENDIHFFLGCAYQGMEDNNQAKIHFESAASGLNEPAAAIFYNDQKPEKIFYQGLALLKLGRQNEAASRFNRLIDYGEEHLFDEVKIDYFAVSLPDLLIWEDDLSVRNQIHCNFMIGLGYMGLRQTTKARRFFENALSFDANHQGVIPHLEMSENLSQWISE